MTKKPSLSKSAAGAAALSLATSLAGADTWEKLPVLPEPNGGAIIAVADGRVAVVGGTNWRDDRKHWLTSVHFLDVAKLQWETTRPLPQAIAYGVWGSHDGALVIVGGSTGTAPFPGLIRVTGASRAATSQASGGSPVPAVLSAGGVIGDEMVFSGGTNDAANVAGFQRSTHALNLRTGQLRVLADYPGPIFGTAASIVVGDELLVFGGATWDAKNQAVVNLAEAQAFSPKLNRWRALKALPFAVRGIAVVALDARYLYLAGGYDNEGFTDRALVYDLKEDRYLAAPPLPFRVSTSLAASDGHVYCVAGEDKAKHRSDLVYRIRAAALHP